MQGPGRRPDRDSRFRLSGNWNAAGVPPRRYVGQIGSRLSVAVPVAVALAVALAAGCGPEMFHRSAETQVLPGTGGAAGELADAGPDGAGGADNSDTGPS